MKKTLLAIAVALLLALIGIQLVPVERSNPPVTEPLVVDDPTIVDLLRRACYDCHSNETRWPWYAYVAPVSWDISEHVIEGRQELNFSEWGSYSERKQRRSLGEIVEVLDEGSMPLTDYSDQHPEAQLTTTEMETLRAWAESQQGR
ncbi:MAG: heme-binding domain-containing protein [Planctomycetota bacterium]|jgi:hypothetical protein